LQSRLAPESDHAVNRITRLTALHQDPLSPSSASQLTQSSESDDLVFPQGFLWGVATSAHQVEGDNANNQWHAWESAGRIKSGDSCGNACGWWTDCARDFDRARNLGINALRLSVEWSRVEPRPGEWDQAALTRYRAMLRALRDRAIRPFVTLHHFTHPVWFEQGDGFLDPASPDRFERFAGKVVEALGDLCSDWVTFNEPNVYCAMAYALGEFPPGRKGEIASAFRSMGNMALAHARSYRAIHQLQPGAQVGWAHNYVVFHAANPRSPLDRTVAWLQHELFNQAFVSMVRDGEMRFPLGLMAADLREVRGTCDFVGLNAYSRFHVAFDPANKQQFYGQMFVPRNVPQGDPGVDMPYGEAYPPVISAAIAAVRALGKPVYILENGVPDAADRIRPWLLVNSLRELHSNIRDGVDVRGYFHWTLTDNFEWGEGWKLRFGLFHLDEVTQQRTLRESGRIYSRIIRANAIPVELLAQFAGPPPNL
jgi:beta-glucosidase